MNFTFQCEFFALQREWKPFPSFQGKNTNSPGFFFLFLTSKKEESLLYTYFLIEAEVLCCHLLHVNGNFSFDYLVTS